VVAGKESACSEVSRLPGDSEGGGCDPRGVTNRLFAILLPEMRALASGFTRVERAGHTLQPTALVNEVYWRVAKTWLGRRPLGESAG
jgi:hypothetical protein